MTNASILSFNLLFVGELMRQVERGETTLSAAQAGSIAATLDDVAKECAGLEKALAVARRWGPGMLDLQDCLLRDVAIRDGVRAGRVIDLVTVLEREMARNSARHGGAA